MILNNRNFFLFPMIFGWLFVFIPDAIAGCRINYNMANMSQEKITSYVQVKSRGGTWVNLKKGSRTHKACFYKKNGRKKCIRRRHSVSRWFTLPAGAEVSGIHSATFGCKAKRRYRFELTKGTCKKYIYYPSATGWTKSQTINFGDISRYCR